MHLVSSQFFLFLLKTLCFLEIESNYDKYHNTFYKNQRDVEILEVTFAVGDFSNVKALKVSILSRGKEKLKYAHSRKKLSTTSLPVILDLSVIIWWIHSGTFCLKSVKILFQKRHAMHTKLSYDVSFEGISFFWGMEVS